MEKCKTPVKKKEVVYKTPFTMSQLESSIDKALDELNFGGLWESAFRDINDTLKELESKLTFVTCYSFSASQV